RPEILADAQGVENDELRLERVDDLVQRAIDPHRPCRRFLHADRIEAADAPRHVPRLRHPPRRIDPDRSAASPSVLRAGPSSDDDIRDIVRAEAVDQVGEESGEHRLLAVVVGKWILRADDRGGLAHRTCARPALSALTSLRYAMSSLQFVSALKLRSTASRAARPIASILAGSAASAVTASTMASGQATGTKYPETPSCTISPSAPVRVVIAGRPEAIASITAIGVASPAVGMTKRSAAA